MGQLALSRWKNYLRVANKHLADPLGVLKSAETSLMGITFYFDFKVFDLEDAFIVLA